MFFQRSLMIVLLTAHSVYGQSSIHGIIRNAETSEPLPYANIYIEDTYIGTASNEEGQYVLQISRLPSVLIVSYLGFETERVVIDTFPAETIDVALKRTALELPEVMVRAGAEDPAIRIMREVIANKIKHKGRLKSYKANAYTRARFENDTSIVSISESFTVVYWDHMAGSVEEFIERNSPDQLSYLAAMSIGSKDIFNFTQDHIPIADFDFIGPTHPDALKLYDFKLVGREYLHDKIVYEISCQPKSKLQPLFTGTVSVLDENYVLLAVDLTTCGAFGLHPMLRDFKGEYRQKYSSFGKEFWLPVDTRSDEEVIFDMGLLAFPRIKFSKISILSDYEVNTDISEHIARLSAPQDTTSADSTEEQPLVELAEFARVPLNRSEQQLYDHPDTTLTLFGAFKPRGLLAPVLLNRADEIEVALETDSDYTMSPVNLESKLGYQVWLNRTEGFHLGLKYRYNWNPLLRAKVLAGYQTHAEKIFYDAEIDYIMNNRQPEKILIIRYSDKTVPIRQSMKYSQMVTSILPVAGENDYFDYYHNRSLSAGLKHGIDDWKMHISVQLNAEYHTSVARQYECDVFNANYTQRSNPPIDEGQLNSIILMLEYDGQYGADFYERTFGDRKYTNVGLSIEHSSADYLNSDFDYTQVSGFLDVTWKTFFKTRPDFNYLRTRLVGSTYSGDLPLQKLTAIDGSLLSYSPFGIFKTRLNQPIQGESIAALFWEYNFTSIPFEFLGLRYCAHNKWEFSLHGAHGRTWMSDDRLLFFEQFYPPFYEDDYHHELGISIKIKYHFMSAKFDLTRNLKTNNDYFGFSLELISFSI